MDKGASYTLCFSIGCWGFFLVFYKFKEQSLEVPEDAWGCSFRFLSRTPHPSVLCEGWLGIAGWPMWIFAMITESLFAWGDEPPAWVRGSRWTAEMCLHPAPRNAHAVLRRLIEGKRSVPFCPLISPSLCCQKWLQNGSSVIFLCRNGLVTFISSPLCILAYSFCVCIYPKSLLGVLD